MVAETILVVVCLSLYHLGFCSIALSFLDENEVLDMSYWSAVLRIRIRDPGSGAFLTPGAGITGWVKSKDPGSEMNNPDHISYSFETNFLS